MTITFDLPADIADLLTQKASQDGQEVAAYVRHLAVREAAAGGQVVAPRTPGLHAGRYWIANDFDAPLSD